MRATRLAKTKKGAGAIDVASLELGCGEADEFSRALEILFRQIHIPLLVTAVGAPGLALETEVHRKNLDTEYSRSG